MNIYQVQNLTTNIDSLELAMKNANRLKRYQKKLARIKKSWGVVIAPIPVIAPIGLKLLISSEKLRYESHTNEKREVAFTVQRDKALDVLKPFAENGRRDIDNLCLKLSEKNPELFYSETWRKSLEKPIEDMSDVEVSSVYAALRNELKL